MTQWELIPKAVFDCGRLGSRLRFIEAQKTHTSDNMNEINKELE